MVSTHIFVLLHLVCAFDLIFFALHPRPLFPALLGTPLFHVPSGTIDQVSAVHVSFIPNTFPPLRRCTNRDIRSGYDCYHPGVLPINHQNTKPWPSFPRVLDSASCSTDTDCSLPVYGFQDLTRHTKRSQDPTSSSVTYLSCAQFPVRIVPALSLTLGILTLLPFSKISPPLLSCLGTVCVHSTSVVIR